MLCVLVCCVLTTFFEQNFIFESKTDPKNPDDPLLKLFRVYRSMSPENFDLLQQLESQMTNKVSPATMKLLDVTQFKQAPTGIKVCYFFFVLCTKFRTGPPVDLRETYFNIFFLQGHILEMIYNKKITNNENCKAVSQIMTAVHAVVKSDKEVPEAYKVSSDFYIAHPYIYLVDAHEWE